MSESFGMLRNVLPREHWPNEAHDFTPWLAQNIGALNEAIGLELQVENTEVAVGPYSADILAKDTGTDSYAIIENQLEKTDHDHLGKLITYSAVLDAKAVIWVAHIFTDEHRKAIDWLNTYCSGEISFYAVKLEVWRIDDSKPALRFNVLSGPSEVDKQTIIARSNDEVSETKKLQQEFWSLFRDQLKVTNAVPSLQAPRPQYWYNVSLGRSGIHLQKFFNSFENRVGVRVYIRSYVADTVLRALEPERKQIETEIGATLNWVPHPDKMDKTIGVHHPAILTARDKWTEYADWMVDMTIKMRKAFQPRLQKLILTAASEDEKQEE